MHKTWVKMYRFLHPVNSNMVFSNEHACLPVAINLFQQFLKKKNMILWRITVC